MVIGPISRAVGEGEERARQSLKDNTNLNIYSWQLM